MYQVKQSAMDHPYFKPGNIVIDFDEWQSHLSAIEKIRFSMGLLLGAITREELKEKYLFGVDAAGTWHRIKKDMCEVVPQEAAKRITRNMDVLDKVVASYGKTLPAEYTTGRGARKRAAKARKAK